MQMPQNNFNQPYIYCSICHRHYTREDPLNLTSCAHTLCTAHTTTTGICPVCDTRDISIIRLNENKTLPRDVQIFFEPLPEMLETLHNISQFQLNGLIGQVHYFQNHCIKLREKVARQQQLLYKAKQELDTVANLKSKVSELEYQLRRAQESTGTRSNFFSGGSFSGSSRQTSDKSLSLHPPVTVDLTMDDGGYEERNFVSKLKKNSLLMGIKSGKHQTTTGSPSGYLQRRANSVQIRGNTGEVNGSNYHPYGTPSSSIIAESTQLQKYVYSPNTQAQNQPRGSMAITNGHISKLPPLGSPSLTMRGQSSLSYGSLNGVETKNSPLGSLPINNGQPRQYVNGFERTKPRQSSNVKSGLNFPTPLDNLRIVKRNNTTINEIPRTISNSKGLSPHMRSSIQTQVQAQVCPGSGRMKNLLIGRRSATSERFAASSASSRSRRYGRLNGKYREPKP